MTDKPTPEEEKARRLAEALRANLRRRKAAARKAPAATTPRSGDGK
ncbi:MAG TPA: hypothetical protein PK417_08750 [Hyphomonas sp.]|nr:hypothetical protein [Hyphomonas sp.]HRX72998.1 hypothetical protein [Hyphomonas sp.]